MDDPKAPGGAAGILCRHLSCLNGEPLAGGRQPSHLLFRQDRYLLLSAVGTGQPSIAETDVELSGPTSSKMVRKDSRTAART